MRTTFVTRVPKSSRTCMTCSYISPAVRERVRPAAPVAQKAHPMAQPACEEAQTARRSLLGMPTHSTETLSGKRRRYFRLPSAETWRATSSTPPRLQRSASCALRDFGRFDICSKELTFFSHIHSSICLARNFGCPSSSRRERSCPWDRLWRSTPGLVPPAALLSSCMFWTPQTVWMRGWSILVI